MKKILIVAPFCSLPSEPNFNRFLYIAELLSKSYNVTLLTSKFRHFDKTHRKNIISTRFKTVLINELGYSSNVSIKRLISHKIFTHNFRKWLDANFDFDLVYSAYPLIETNIILAKFKTSHEFKLVIDIQDIWPESISSAFPLLNYLPYQFLPFTKKANKAYAAADSLVAVSNTYLKRAKTVNQTALSEMVYIGSDFSIIEQSTKLEGLGNNFKLVYIGTLSHSYDVETIIKAVNKLNLQGYDIEFHIFGGGPFENKLKKLALNECIFFHGFVDITQVYSFLKSSNVAVNCLSKSAKQSVTNKLSDYLSIGIPILNSQSNKEVLQLLETVNHENYVAGDIADAIEKILRLYHRRIDLTFKPNNSFNRDIEYKKIIRVIKNLVE